MHSLYQFLFMHALSFLHSFVHSFMHSFMVTVGGTLKIHTGRTEFANGGLGEWVSGIISKGVLIFKMTRFSLRISSAHILTGIVTSVLRATTRLVDESIYKIITMPRWRRWIQRRSRLASAKSSSIRRWSNKIERDIKPAVWPTSMKVTRKRVYAYLSKSFGGGSVATRFGRLAATRRAVRAENASAAMGARFGLLPLDPLVVRNLVTLLILVVFSNVLGMMIRRDYFCAAGFHGRVQMELQQVIHRKKTWAKIGLPLPSPQQWQRMKILPPELLALWQHHLWFYHFHCGDDMPQSSRLSHGASSSGSGRPLVRDL